MTAVIVFLIVGSIAILSAALMLISENAVHSALFLVLNFLCVAFFFLTLGAPFIALVQVAVYAGAIMVLFLFVIMLLGAEKIAPSSGPVTWLPRAALILAILFLITAGSALASGEINLHAPPLSAPQVRVIHAAEAPPVDVYLNNQLFVEGVDFRDATDYMKLAAGEYGVTVFPAGADPATESPSILGELTLVEGDVVSMVALGAEGVYQISRLEDQLSAAEDDQVRVTLLNGLPEAGNVDLVDPGLELKDDDSTVLISEASFGEAVETLLLSESGALTLDVMPAGELAGDAVASFRDLELVKGSNYLLIPAQERLSDGRMRVVPLNVAVQIPPVYGSPQHVGQVLFTSYLLPFELVSILLLAAMVGAIVLTQRELVAEYRPRRPVVRRPLVGPQAASALAASTTEDESVGQLLKPGTGK